MKRVKAIKQIKAMFMTGLLGTGLVTAGVATADESRDAASSTLLTMITMGDGTKVAFHEPIPGDIAVLSQHPVTGEGGSSPLTEALRTLSATEDDVDVLGLFMLLSPGTEPPKELVEAYARVEQARKESNETPEGGKPSEADLKDIPTLSDDSRDTFELNAAIGSGTWFRQNYCPLTTDYCYCMLYRTGSGSITKTTDHMRSATYPYRGTVTHKLQYWFFGYRTSISQTVPQGWVGQIWVTGGTRIRRAVMSNASGDGFHWSVYGGLTLGCLPTPCYCSIY